MSLNTIIGIGNLNRGDDAFGLLVARRLRDEGGVSARVLEQEGDGTQLIRVLGESEAAFIVDAADFGAAPGSLYCLDAAAERIPANLATESTHGFGLAQVIELARVLGALPRVCRIYAVQMASCEAGLPVSSPVAASIPIVATRIRMELRRQRVSARTRGAGVLSERGRSRN